MTAENVAQTGGLSIAGFARWGAGPSKRERNFYIALAVALILHASFFISAIQSGGDPKRLGAESGADDAISVSLVTEQDLQSKATVADEVSPPPGPVAPTQEQQQAKPPPQQPPQEQQPQPPTPPQPEQAKEEPQPPEPQQPPPQPQAQETPQPPDTPQPDAPQDADPAKPETVAKQEDTVPDSQPPNLFSLDDQDPSKQQSKDEPKPKPKTEPKQETKRETKKPSTSKAAKKSSSKSQNKLAALDLSTQALAPSLSGGGGEAAFQRPPGITRSGINDKFARDVIRALQQTMPQLANTLGRVTVRIFLSDSGNVISVALLVGSKDSSLNQDVVFAAKQTSYPIPPAGSNEADRTFMVTYIYD
jgi:periplasmic protein TonB